MVGRFGLLKMKKKESQRKGKAREKSRVKRKRNDLKSLHVYKEPKLQILYSTFKGKWRSKTIGKLPKKIMKKVTYKNVKGHATKNYLIPKNE